MGLSLRLRMARASVAALWSGARWHAPGILLEIIWRGLRGAPWRDLPPPENERMAACRDMVGPVVLLDDALRQRLGKEAGRAVVAAIVRDSALVQLATLVPATEVQSLRELPGDEREPRLQAMVQRFPNATVGKLELSESSFAYPVTGCAFVTLCQAIDRADLATVFCAADALHFERNLVGVHFERPETLAEGGQRCDFRFRW